MVSPCETSRSCRHLAGEGKLNYDRVAAHFLTINACRLEDFEEHRRQAFAQWRARNRYEWQTDLGAYAYLIPQDVGGSLT
jgi:hypothetical protein